MGQNNLKRCEDSNIDFHRASYSRHLKTETFRKKEIKPRKIGEKGVVKETNKTKNIKRNDEIEYKVTDNKLKIAYDMIVDRHLKKDLISQITITSKVDTLGKK